MNAGRLDFWARLWMWIWLPWKVLFDGAAAWKVQRALATGAGAEVEASSAAADADAEARAAAATAAAAAAEAKARAAAEAELERQRRAGALQLLAILQRDGRLVDFLQEELGAASDVDVGAAARIVHEGCRKALGQYVTLAPIRSEAEGTAISIAAGFDPAELRLTGNVVGDPPFRGRIAHPGWRATEVRIPTLTAGQDTAVVAPAEVEV